MNPARRERIRELVRELEAVQERVQALVIEEDDAFEGRSYASKETESGMGSKDAAYFLNLAADDIQNAIDNMQLASGDESLPDPKPATHINRRGL